MLKARLLTVTMLLLGILLVVGSTMSIFGTTLLPFDNLAGTDTTVAGVAFGVGIAIASFNPEGNLSWVRIAIVYTILLVAYRFIFALAWGLHVSYAALLIGVLFGAALIVLYPHRGELMPRRGGASDRPTAGAHS
jgi:peptidoglycan/LPS O-acetylase OafA/YrhL